MFELHDVDDNKTEQNEIIAGIYFEAVVPTRKNNLFHQLMIGFVNLWELNYHKYQTNGTVRDENYNGKFVFPMKDFMSFGKYSQSMFF